MHFLQRKILIQALVACSLCVFVASPALAQKEPERVRISTVDGVNLFGTYYAGRGRAPTVLMLHAFGQDSKQSGWTTLAKTLQEAGYSVLTFDFRGHGESTEVDAQEFWNATKHPNNRPGFIRGRSGRTSIEYKDFSPSYLPVLINDIAAAKAYLDRKNDSGSCNTGSFILIGAEEGAALGSIWMNSEWHRHRLKDGLILGQKLPEDRPEGEDIIAAIWLSMTPYLSTNKRAALNIPGILSVAGKVKATPMLFLYGREDSKGKKLARYYESKLVDYMRDPANRSKKIRTDRYKYTAALPVATRLKGADLLQKSLGTSKNIAKYLEEVILKKGNQWEDKDFKKTTFMWLMGSPLQSARLRFARRLFLPCKPSGELNLAYSDYRRFMSR